MTFKDFITHFDFEDLHPEYAQDYDMRDTKIIRILYGNSIRDWFEFGVYAFDGDAWNRISKVLSDEILNSYVVDFTVNIHGTLEVTLCDKKDIELIEGR